MNSKDLNDVFEREEINEPITETKEVVTKRKRQPIKKKLDLDFEKEKDEFMKSLLSKPEGEPVKKETKSLLDVNERKLKLIENLKKAREQKKANKQPPKEEVKQEVKQEVVKQKEEVDPEYLEWKKQKQVKQEVKVEQVKQEVKVEPVKIPQPIKPYVIVSNYKKPMWGR